MDRKSFLKSLFTIPLINKSMNLNQLANYLPNTPTMPVLFLGHGSPMNAIEDNIFTQGFKKLALTLPKPNAIICISAHWETNGTFVTAMEKPKTIHDFGGFPKELFSVQYPAPGDVELAKQTKTIYNNKIELDTNWGLDHGCWSVLTHLYPKADVPVIQFSLNYKLTPNEHFNLAKQLQTLRNKGVLIIGSGNIVHNLGLVAWDKLNQTNYAYDWAQHANNLIIKHINELNFNPLINYQKLGKEMTMAIPTPEHYLPLLYCLALKQQNDKVEIFNNLAVAGSLTMTSFKFG
jgi:4,5-DOPA dioxygenase extradiol